MATASDRLSTAVKISRDNNGTAVRGVFSIEGTRSTFKLSRNDCLEQLDSSTPALLEDVKLPPSTRACFTSKPSDPEAVRRLVELSQTVRIPPLAITLPRTFDAYPQRNWTRFETSTKPSASPTMYAQALSWSKDQLPQLLPRAPRSTMSWPTTTLTMRFSPTLRHRKGTSATSGWASRSFVRERRRLNGPLAGTSSSATQTTKTLQLW